jgi:homoserine dehydrogenase
MSECKDCNVAVLGQGTVGGNVVDTLLAKRDTLSEKAGRPVNLSAIFIRDPQKGGRIYQDHPALYRGLDDILLDSEIHVVCELMGGVDTARDAIMRALGAGKHVVSANKALLATDGSAIVDQARASNVQLRFEAAVAGGIPILGVLAHGAASETITRLCGIVNGTTNYILTSMGERGMDYSAALGQAKQLGYAEQDERADVLGFDARQKLSLLIGFAFGQHISPDDIPVTGINDVTLQDIEHAAQMKCVIKLIARAELVDGSVTARVGPEIVPMDSPLGQIPANLNAIQVTSDLNMKGNIYSGEGAGGKPTAASVVSDVVAIARNLDAGFREPFGRRLNHANNLPDLRAHSFYVRFIVGDSVGILHDITGIFKKYNINVNSLIQLPYEISQRDHLPFYITVEDTTEENLQCALSEIAALKFNVAQPSYIRFERDHPWVKE